MRSHVLGALAAAILAACGANPAPESLTETARTEEPASDERGDETTGTGPQRTLAPPDGLASDGLRWSFVATPASVTMATRASVRLTRSVTNEGAALADAMHASASFAVNGAASMSLDLAFGNGLRGGEWASLPPGQTASDARDMGEDLFPVPGDYDLAMTTDGVTVHAHVHVDP